jgi:hypothetical protein
MLGVNMFVIVETFLNPGEPSNAVYRVRPVNGQVFPSTMRVQCSRAMRQAFALGSKFRLPVEMVENKTGSKFLREVGKEAWVRVADSEIHYPNKVTLAVSKSPLFLKCL